MTKHETLAIDQGCSSACADDRAMTAALKFLIKFCSRWSTLLLLFYLGLAHVSVPHCIFVLFFCIFFIWPRIARKYWYLLIGFSMIYVLSAYTFVVLANVFGLSAPKGSVLRLFGLFAPVSFEEAIAYSLLILLEVIELNSYKQEHQSLPVPVSVLRWQYRAVSMLCYLSFLGLALIPGLSVISLGYLCLFFVCSAVSPTASNPRSSLGSHLAWYTAAIYSGCVVILSYLYQFGQLRRLMDSWLVSVDLSAEVIGLFEYKHLSRDLAPWSIALILTVYRNSIFNHIQNSIRLERDHSQDPESSLSARIKKLFLVCTALWYSLAPKLTLIGLLVAALNSQSYYSQNAPGAPRLQPFSEETTDCKPKKWAAPEGVVVPDCTCVSVGYVLISLILNHYSRVHRVGLSICAIYPAAVAIAIYTLQFAFMDPITDAITEPLLAYIGLNADDRFWIGFQVWPHVLAFSALLIQLASVEWSAPKWSVIQAEGSAAADAVPLLRPLPDDQVSGASDSRIRIGDDLEVVATLENWSQIFWRNCGVPVFLLLQLISSWVMKRTCWSIILVLSFGLLGKFNRAYKFSRAYWGVMEICFAAALLLQFALLLGPPVFWQEVIPLYPNVAYACQIWGPYYNYLVLQPDSVQLITFFMLIVGLGCCRSAVPEASTVEYAAVSFTDVLDAKIVDILRIRNQVDEKGLSALKLLLPSPDSPNFFDPPHSLVNRLLGLIFRMPPYLSLLMIFVFAVSAPSITFLHLAQVFGALVLIHFSAELTWQCNRWWKYPLRLWYLIGLLQTIIDVPTVIRHIADVPAFEIFGIGTFSMQDPLYLLILVMVYAQSLVYDDVRYTFVLYRMHSNAIEVRERSKNNAIAIRAQMQQLKHQEELRRRERRQRLVAIRRSRRHSGSKIEYGKVTFDPQMFPKGVGPDDSFRSGPESREAADPATEPKVATQPVEEAKLVAVDSRLTDESTTSLQRFQGLEVDVSPSDEIEAAVKYSFKFVFDASDWLTNWLLSHSRAAESQLFSEADLAGSDRSDQLSHALLQFILSYTDWLCYIVFVYNAIYHPSYWAIVLPISAFGYALLLTPHRWYWDATLAYVELTIVVKVTFQLVLNNNVYFGSPIWLISATSKSNFFTDMVSDLFLVLLLVLHKGMLKWGMWYVGDDIDLQSPITSPTTPSPSGSLQDLWGGFVGWWRRRISMEDKLGIDVYVFEILFDLIFFIGLLFSYYSLVGSDSDFLSSVQANLLPGPLVLIQAGLFLLIVANRIVYLFRSLRAKLFLHFLFTGLYVLFWWLIFLKPRNRDTIASNAQFLFVVKAIQLAYSGQQIKYGYPRILTNRFTDEYKPYKHLAYQVFRAIPFVFELRSLLDWTFTPTTLKFFYWLKLEDIHHELLNTRNDFYDTKRLNRPLGYPFPKWPKFYFGFGLFATIASVLFMPLLYYSSFSPAMTPNAVNATAVEVGFVALPPLFTGQVVTDFDYSLPSHEAAELAKRIEWTRHATLQRRQFSEQSLQLVTFPKYSQTSWTISPPATRRLVEQLSNKKRPVHLLVTAHVTRARGFGSPTHIITQTLELSNTTRVEFIQALMPAGPTPSPNGTQPNTTATSSLPTTSPAVPLTPPSPSPPSTELDANATSTNSTTATANVSSAFVSPSPATSKPALPSPSPSASPLSASPYAARLHSNRTSSVRLPCLYSPFLFNSPVTVSTYYEFAGCEETQDCQLNFHSEDGVIYTSLQCRSLFMFGNGDDPSQLYTPDEMTCFHTLGTGKCPRYDTADRNARHAWSPLYFAIASAMVPSGSGLGGLFESLGIMTLYSTFILTLGRVLRWLLTGMAYRVPLEDMQDPTRLIQLVEDIKLARAEGDLKLEEQLYRELIAIYQSTELLRRCTAAEDQSLEVPPSPFCGAAVVDRSLPPPFSASVPRGEGSSRAAASSSTSTSSSTQ